MALQLDNFAKLLLTKRCSADQAKKISFLHRKVRPAKVGAHGTMVAILYWHVSVLESASLKLLYWSFARLAQHKMCTLHENSNITVLKGSVCPKVLLTVGGDLSKEDLDLLPFTKKLESLDLDKKQYVARFCEWEHY